MLTVGETIDERYKIDGFLGEGGMCTVFRATQTSMDRTVALKLLRSAANLDEDTIKRFQREAMSIATLKHTNIIEAYGFGEHDGAPYMAIEFLEGESLADVLLRDFPLPKERFVHICKQICDALEHAHSQGIVHRDLKPSNVMLLSGDKVKVVDFGIAKLLPESGKDIQRLTQTGEIFGTLLYMSPEQVSEADIDARSDVYALGCNMYEMLTGKPPFTADTPYAIIAKHLNTAPKSNEELGVFEPLILSCLEKRREDRPQSAAQVKEYLDAPSTVPKRGAPVKRRKALTKPQLAWISAVSLIVLAAWYAYEFLSVPKMKGEELASLSQKLKNEIAVGRWENAETHLRRALALSEELKKPDEFKQTLRARLAQVYYQEKKFVEMKTAATQLKWHHDPSTYDEGYGVAIQTIADYYAGNREWDEAREWFAREATYFGGFTAGIRNQRWPFVREARMELEAGQYKEAIDFANATQKVTKDPLDEDYRRAQLILVEANYLLARKQTNPADRAKFQAEGDKQLEEMLRIGHAGLIDAGEELYDKYGGADNATKPIDTNWLLQEFNYDRERRTLYY